MAGLNIYWTPSILKKIVIFNPIDGGAHWVFAHSRVAGVEVGPARRSLGMAVPLRQRRCHNTADSYKTLSAARNWNERVRPGRFHDNGGSGYGAV
jgi:hypothetical protein